MRRSLMLLLALCSMIVGCQGPQTFVGTYDFSDNCWEKDQSLVFDFTTFANRELGEIRLALRYTANASGQVAQLMIKTTNSNEISFVDTLNVTLNRGSGDVIRSQEIIVRKNVMWPKTSHHYITIVPDRMLRDMVSVSLQIDNAVNED